MEDRFFKFERLQYYSQPGTPSYEALEQGRFFKALRLVQESIKAEAGAYSSARGRGVDLVRVRVVELPLSRYLRYEFVGYLTNHEMGEDVRVLEAADCRDLPERLGDFLLFDDKAGLIHNYIPPQNIQDGGWLVDDASELAKLTALAETLLARSVPLDEVRFELG